jgi:fatty-acyl-CoA synthase
MTSGKELKDIQEIKQKCKNKMAEYEIPKEVLVWEGPWPMTSEGKTNLRILQKEVEERLGIK